MREITAHELRQLAESADGQRGRTMRVVLRDGTFKLVESNDILPTDESTQLVVKSANVRVETAKRLDSVLVKRAASGQPSQLPKDMDALFWNESSIEKFVIPYYSRLLKPDDLRKLWDAHLDPNVYAVAHCCRSVGFAITDSADSVQIVQDSREASPDSPPSIISLRDWHQQ